MRDMLQKAFPLATLIILLISSISFAGPPDAGQLLREQQPQKKLPKQLPTPEEEPEKPAKADTGVRVHLKGFTFSGYEGLITEDELQTLVADVVGKELSFGELQAVVTRVTRHLNAQGWFLARAYLPSQEITSGIIEVAIIQGKSDGSLTVKGDQTVRIREERLHRMGEQAIQEGRPLKTQTLERAVLLMNDLPGVSARASLAPGVDPGSTAVEIRVSEGPLLSGALWGDNYGNRYTGAARGNALVSVNDPFHIGDQLTLIVTGSEDLYLGQAVYSAPLSANGLRGNLSYTGLYYELGKELASIDADGDAHTVNAGMSYPWLRSRRTNIVSTLDYEYKDLSDSSADIDLHNKKLHSATLALSGDRYDTFFGGGLTTWTAGGTLGHMNEETADIAITGMEGGYTLFNVGLARLQRLSQRLMLSLSWRGQFSLDNLDSSEQFSLGGPYGVRAYAVGEGLGDEGHLFNMEIDYDTPLPSRYGTLKWNVFYDAGYITLHKDPWINSIVTATNKDHYWLQGAGIGFAYTYDNKLSVTTFWAHVIGDNDGRSFDDKDSDGKSDNNRFWVQAAWRF